MPPRSRPARHRRASPGVTPTPMSRTSSSRTPDLIGARADQRGPSSATEGVPVARDQHHDVIVIGSGAGGGTLTHRLAPTGKRILLLERGGYLPRERANWDSTEVFVRGKYRAPEFWLDDHGHEFPPEVNYYVGGNTKFYGAALFRLRPEDFGE